MGTTIQISEELKTQLISMKLFDGETYEGVIWDLVEDSRELNAQTRREIELARGEIRAGKIHTLEDVRKELGL